MSEPWYRCLISRISGIARAGFVLLLSADVIGCGAVGPYQAYSGDRLPANAVAIPEGSQYLRQDWLNRQTYAVRFAQVDGEAIVNSVEHERVEIKPGAHEIAVYFYWDMGSARGWHLLWSVTRQPENPYRGFFALRPQQERFTR